MYQANSDKTKLTKGTLSTDKHVTVILNSDDEAVEIFIWKA